MMAVTFRATFCGPHGQQNNPSGALMPGKAIGFGWTNVLIWLRWESNTSLMPSALTHKGPGDQPQAGLRAFPPAHVSEDTHLEQVHENKLRHTP